MPQYMADGIDQKLVAAHYLSNLKKADDYAAEFNNDAVVDLGRKTSTIVIRRKPVVSFKETPKDRDGHLPRTNASSTSFEVTLDKDVYTKPAIDPLDVEPEKQSADLGEAIADGLVAETNADILKELATKGTKAHLGETFTRTMSADKVWDAILGNTANVRATYKGSFVMWVGASFFARLCSGAAVLRGSNDPLAQAVRLAGVSKVIEVPDEVMKDAGALAIVANTNAAVHARVLDQLHEQRVDADVELFTRVRYGSHVTDSGAVVALVDGIEPSEG